MSMTADVADPRDLRAVRNYGDQALLLEFDTTDDVLAWTETIRGAELPGVLDVVPAARTVLVRLAGPRYLAPTRQRLGTLSGPNLTERRLTGAPGQIDVQIDVVYDGPDLDEVAGRTGLSPDQVVEAHTGTPWRVGFGGFAPGFAYLVGGDSRLEVPRRAEPRARVPVGSVGLAGQFSGIYPRQSPGGWQLIGRTDAVLFDVDREKPALLTPGVWVRFRAVG
ncbi:5-oxoprolinase subunit B family protein [Mycolicibacterium sp. XJ1819]